MQNSQHFELASLREFTVLARNYPVNINIKYNENCYFRFVNSLVYYGLSLSTAELAGDRYVNFFISGVVEFIAYFITIFVLQ